MAQKVVEWLMLGISLRDHFWNGDIRQRTEVKDLDVQYCPNKLRLAGHVAQFTNNQCTCIVPKLYPYEQGRPPLR